MFDMVELKNLLSITKKIKKSIKNKKSIIAMHRFPLSKKIFVSLIWQYKEEICYENEFCQRIIKYLKKAWNIRVIYDPKDNLY